MDTEKTIFVFLWGEMNDVQMYVISKEIHGNPPILVSRHPDPSWNILFYSRKSTWKSSMSYSFPKFEKNIGIRTAALR